MDPFVGGDTRPEQRQWLVNRPWLARTCWITWPPPTASAQPPLDGEKVPAINDDEPAPQSELILTQQAIV